MKKHFVLITICLACAFALGAVASEAQVIYGIKHSKGSTTAGIYKIEYKIETDSCVQTPMASPILSQAPTASWNGKAYDLVNDRYYFSQFDNYPKMLWMIENFSTAPKLVEAGELSASISNGTFYNGKYYYIGHLTDDLYEVTFDTDGTVLTESKLDDISNNTKTFYFGDIAYSLTGVLYGSTAEGSSGGTRTFFIYDGTTYTAFIDTEAPEALQIAFGDDGVLYGYAISNNTFYTIDTSNGSITPKCTSEIDFSDLVSGGPFEMYSLCAGQTMNVGYVQVWNDGTHLTVTYNVNNPWCLTETHLHVATKLTDIPQKNGNPQPGHFDYGNDELGCVSSWSQKIPLEDISAMSGNNLVIAAHAVVLHLSGDNTTGEEICANFTKVSEGSSVEGFGTVAEHLNIYATGDGDAIKIKEDTTASTTYAAYGAPNNACDKITILNGGLTSDGGFSDLTAKDAKTAHSYAFYFDVPITEFSLRMLDFGDYNPTKATVHLAEMKPSYLGVYGTTQTLQYDTPGVTSPTSSSNPDVGNLLCGTGDAVDADLGEPGNYIWQVSGDGIDKVELVFGTGFDPKIGFDNLCFTLAGTETAWGNGPCDDGTLAFEGKNWATYFTYTVK